MTRRRPQHIPPLPDFPSVEQCVAESTEIWARDLRSLFEHAKERFGDVSWESEGSEDVQRIWGHKAVIYARAPKAFKDRYFISKPFSGSTASLRSPSPSPHLHVPSFPSTTSPQPSSYLLPYPVPRRGSSLSVQTVNSEAAARTDADGIMRLTHGDTPEMFQAQLEWLYTGEGFGDVVEWISAEDDSGIGGSLRDSLGRDGNIADRRDRLGQDLAYMWRKDSDDSTNSLSSTAIFTSHRFILVSRSPYFASVLLNPSSFRPSITADIRLPTPPFTPAALHFCLGYIYAGHLDFSNRTFDLLTAFQIHRAAAYLQLDTLVQEVEARIVHDVCHGLDFDKCHCRRCPARAGRVWRFASASDVGAVLLAKRAQSYLIRGWGESWGRDVGSAEKVERDVLVKEVIRTITPGSVVSAFRSIEMIRTRMESGIRAKGRDASLWVDGLDDMVEAVEAHTRDLLIGRFAEVSDGGELWDLVSGKGFADDLLERLVKEIVDGIATTHGCVEGPRLYQALVSSILLKVDPVTLDAALPQRSRSRQQIEGAKEGVLGHLRRRWMQIREAGGFEGLESWSLKEISDEIEVPVEELVIGPFMTPQRLTRLVVPTPESAPFSAIPRTRSRMTALSEVASVCSTITTASSRPSTLRARPTVPVVPAESSGLRRLHLSTLASTSSVVSANAVLIPRPVIPQSMLGPQARSPTAAKMGATVSIGRPRLSSPSPSPKTTKKAMSGSPRQPVTRPSPKLDLRGTVAKSTPAIAITTVRANGLASKSTNPTGPGSRRELKPTGSTHMPQEAGPSRSRTTSASTMTSMQSKVASLTGKAPLSASTGSSTQSRTPTSSGISPRTGNRMVVKSDEPTRPRTSSISQITSVTGKVLVTSSFAIATSTLPPSSASPRQMVLTSSRIAQNVKPQPVPLKPLSSATASRLRSASNASAASKVSYRNRVPPNSAPTPVLKPSVRSPSSSTDEPPEARTPLSSQIIDPVIRLEGSDDSEFARSVSLVKKFPLVNKPRQERKSSSSSAQSAVSLLRPHPTSAFDPPKRMRDTTSPSELEITDGSMPFSGAGLSFNVGIPCIVSLSQKRARFKAQVKYIGHKDGSLGPWVGIEVEDLERFGVDTLPTGSDGGVHYFHISPPELPSDSNAAAARQTRLDTIRDRMPRKASRLYGLGLGLGRPQEALVSKRSVSPFALAQVWIGIERPRALFVRPSEVVFILDAG